MLLRCRQCFKSLSVLQLNRSEAEGFSIKNTLCAPKWWSCRSILAFKPFTITYRLVNVFALLLNIPVAASCRCELQYFFQKNENQFTQQPHPPTGKWAVAGKYSRLFSFYCAGNLFLQIERKSYFSSRSQSSPTLMYYFGLEHSHSPLK